MDELAIELPLDPVELRLRNEPTVDESLDIPFSSRHLKECLAEGRWAFGWSERNPAVASMRRDGQTVGWGVASASPVQDAVAAAGKKLIEIATAKGGPFEGGNADDLVFEKGSVKPMTASDKQVSFSKVPQAAGMMAVKGEGKGIGNIEEVIGLKKGAKLSSHSFACQFAEVLWQPEIARLRVSRMFAVIDAGRMINPQTARNQTESAMVMGVGMAMFEQMSFDQRSGAPLNSNLADYVMTTHADAPVLDVIFVEYPDYNLNPMGARGVGEIGLAGAAAAITNAVHHATGVRVCELPVRIEDLI